MLYICYIYIFLIRWFFCELFSNAQTKLWHLNAFSLATITAAYKCSSGQKWLRGLVQSINFWDTSPGIGPYKTSIIKKIIFTFWPLVFCRYFSFGILNTRFCVIKHNIALLDKHLEFICVKSEHRLVEDGVYKMITLLLDLMKFFRTPISS